MNIIGGVVKEKKLRRWTGMCNFDEDEIGDEGENYGVGRFSGTNTEDIYAGGTDIVNRYDGVPLRVLKAFARKYDGHDNTVGAINSTTHEWNEQIVTQNRYTGIDIGEEFTNDRNGRLARTFVGIFNSMNDVADTFDHLLRKM